MFFWRNSNQPAPADVDVVPCTAVDMLSRDMTVTFSFFIPGAPLDTEKLRAALDVAIREKMPRAGARLARRNGILEFHIPKTFSEEVPTFQLRKASFGAPFPREKAKFPLSVPDDVRSRPCVVPVTAAPYMLFRGRGTPLHIKQFLVPGTPMLQVFVLAYEDATLIGLTAPHLLLDVQGVAALCRAWTAALNGNLDTIPASPRDYDPFALIMASQTASSTPLWSWGGWYFPSLFSKMYWHILFYFRKRREGPESPRWLWIPHKWLAERKEECMSELKARGSTEFVGSNDVLSAVYWKAAYTGRKDDTPVSLHTVVNLRSVLPSIFTLPYFSNALGHCIAAPIAAAKLGSQSILDTALALRRALVAYTTNKSQLLAELTWVNRAYSTEPAPILPCLPGHEYALTTSWRSANLGDLDFSGARADGSTAKPSFTFGYVPNYRGPGRGGAAVMYESDEGIWMTMCLGESAWDGVRSSGMFAFL